MSEYCSAPAYQANISSGDTSDRRARGHRTDLYFAQSCSTCGRPLRIRIELLGKRLTCPHCGAALVAHELAEDCRTVRRPTNLELAGQLLDQLATS